MPGATAGFFPAAVKPPSLAGAVNKSSGARARWRWGAAGCVARVVFFNVVTISASPAIAAGSTVPGGPLHLAGRSDAHPKTPANGYPRRPPRGPAFSWAPDRKRALVRGSLALGPACQQGRYFVAVTGSRNPPELRDFIATTAN